MTTYVLVGYAFDNTSSLRPGDDGYEYVPLELRIVLPDGISIVQGDPSPLEQSPGLNALTFSDGTGDAVSPYAFELDGLELTTDDAAWTGIVFRYIDTGGSGEYDGMLGLSFLSDDYVSGPVPLFNVTGLDVSSYAKLVEFFELTTAEDSSYALQVAPQEAAVFDLLDVPGVMITEDDVIVGTAASETFYSGIGNDTVTAKFGADWVYGGTGNDWLAGKAGRDHIFGGKGHDRLFGGMGDDTLNGGRGEDKLFGGFGRDVLDGALGDDELEGGGGADEFRFGVGYGDDVVTDFGTGADELVFDPALWSGELTADEVVDAFAEVEGSDLVFRFDGGESLTLLGYTDVAAIADDISFA
ncbi:calcium-binding protein [Mangrovicoccus sp. HB161399]|uniref:calcium-binding protein n=1 Tax=Mangrovicoccus sp. HB161399 TaxID=2720392 RepID=UPI001555ABA9|nr:calcium-binding protein [Mangrovicoccus sp. HB161399]